MSRTDIKNNVSVVQHIAPSANTATVTPSSGVDLANYDAAVVVIDVGAVSDGAFSFEVQESDSESSGFTAVDDADLDGTEPATISANEVHEIGYHGIARYIRVVATDDGTADASFGVSVVRAKARSKAV